MPIRDPLAPSAPLFRVLDSQVERRRISDALGTSVAEVDGFASGQSAFTLGQFITLLEKAGLEVVESSELSAIKRFAARYLRMRVEG